MSIKDYQEEFLACLLGAEFYRAQEIIDCAAKEFSAEDVLLEVVIPAINKLGDRWAKKDIALTQLYVASRIAEEAINKLTPRLRARPPVKGRAVIGTIYGDHHAFGKDVVIKFLRAARVEVVDLGLSVEPETFVDRAIKEKADIIFVSALMLHTAMRISEISELLKEKKQRIKLVVGGAPFNFDKNLYRKLGAHETVRNAADAVNVVRKLMEGRG
jgi:methanogenic corrinoid protein MtbC1